MSGGGWKKDDLPQAAGSTTLLVPDWYLKTESVRKLSVSSWSNVIKWLDLSEAQRVGSAYDEMEPS